MAKISPLEPLGQNTARFWGRNPARQLPGVRRYRLNTAFGVWRLAGELLCSCRRADLYIHFTAPFPHGPVTCISRIWKNDRWLRFHCALHKCIQKWRFKNDVPWRHKWLRSIKIFWKRFVLWRRSCMITYSWEILLKSFCLLLPEIDRTVTATSLPKLPVTLVIRWTVVDSSSKVVL